MTQRLLSFDQIRDVKELQEKIVDVPEWNGSIKLKEMTAKECMRFNKVLELHKGEDAGMYILLMFSARNADDTLLFNIQTVEAIRANIEVLQGKSIDVLNTLQREALKLNRMDVASREAAKKASGEAVTSASPSS